jgi:hypothetical protein
MELKTFKQYIAEDQINEYAAGVAAIGRLLGGAGSAARGVGRSIAVNRAINGVAGGVQVTPNQNDPVGAYDANVLNQIDQNRRTVGTVQERPASSGGGGNAPIPNFSANDAPGGKSVKGGNSGLMTPTFNFYRNMGGRNNLSMR